MNESQAAQLLSDVFEIKQRLAAGPQVPTQDIQTAFWWLMVGVLALLACTFLLAVQVYRGRS